MLFPLAMLPLVVTMTVVKPILAFEVYQLSRAPLSRSLTFNGAYRRSSSSVGDVRPTATALCIATSSVVPKTKTSPPSVNDVESPTKSSTTVDQSSKDRTFWKIGGTLHRGQAAPLTPELRMAMEAGAHPAVHADDLGRGLFIVDDWRGAWNNYESPPSTPSLIDPMTGHADYVIDEVEGIVPDNLVGTLYRNGPGLFGRGDERAQHVLDADGLVCSITFPSGTKTGKRDITFRSHFVETKAFKEEASVDQFLHRSVFGTGPSAFFDNHKKNGLNGEPTKRSALSKMFAMFGKIGIKNSANTQAIYFGGKLLALFEAGLPYALDPVTLKTLGEDSLGGILKPGPPVKFGQGYQSLEPDFLGGDAHTAHPKICPKSGNLVGWNWAQQFPANAGMRITLTEWSPKGFKPVASNTFSLPGCEVAPHDMAITENFVVLKVNAFKIEQLPFLLGIKGPAASMKMDGRSPATVWIAPRPTSKHQFDPFPVQVPPCFSIHFSHGYEDEKTGNVVVFFSGWPESDSTDFLGALGGFAPDFQDIPPTFLWRLEIDPKSKSCVSLDIAPGSSNACIDFIVVHPNFNIKKAQYVYGCVSNLIGDSSPQCGYAKCHVECGNSGSTLSEGEFNSDVDAYWFGVRYFVAEPVIVPKQGGDPDDEEDAYLLGMVHDAAQNRGFLAIFDLKRDLKQGPIAKLWLKSSVPIGIHGCFAAESGIL